MNLERTKPETLAAGVMDYMPQSLAAHEYAERLNAALARLGLTDRLTLPPAPNTAIDELPGVVDVPLRKTLSVLMGKAQQGDASALATLEMVAQLAESIFAGLHARASVYPLALPSHESLATLSQGVDALLPRKISNGAWSLLADGTPSDGIDDGVSLVRLLCSSAADSVTELKDDNEGWTFSVSNELLTLMRQFLKLERVTFGCKEITQCIFNTANYKEMNTRTMIMHFPNLKTIFNGCVFYNYGGVSGHDNNVGYSEAHLDVLEETNMPNNGGGAFKTTKLYMPSFKRGLYRFGGSASYANLTTIYMYLGCQGSKTDTIILTDYLYGGDKNNLEDLEIRDGACQNFTLSGPFNSLTAENMYNHILCRLKQDEPMCGEGVTITLGTTNIDKIEAVEEYNLKLTELTDIYGYTFA